MDASRTFQGVTKEQFFKMRTTLLNDHGTQVHCVEEGDITGHGVSARYTYDGSNLTVVIHRHPFFVPTNFIFDQISEKLEDAAKAIASVSEKAPEPEAGTTAQEAPAATAMVDAKPEAPKKPVTKK